MPGFNLVFTEHGEKLQIVNSSTHRVTVPGCPDRAYLNDMANTLTQQLPKEWQRKIHHLYTLELSNRTKRLALYRELQSTFPTLFQPMVDAIVLENPEQFI